MHGSLRHGVESLLDTADMLHSSTDVPVLTAPPTVDVADSAASLPFLDAAGAGVGAAGAIQDALAVAPRGAVKRAVQFFSPPPSANGRAHRAAAAATAAAPPNCQ